MREIIDWRPARLRSVRDVTPDIRLFEIAPSGNFSPPPPGSHINVIVRIDGRPDVRSYSIVGPCDDGIYRIATKLLPDSRGGSAYMHGLQPGAQLTISDPGNHFALAPFRPEYLLIAGGIGITPIYTMALALAGTDEKFRLLYACRSRRDLAFADDLRERLGERLMLFIGDEGGRIDLVAEIARLPPAANYMCVDRSVCWRRPSACGTILADRWICCASRRLATADFFHHNRSRCGSRDCGWKSWSRAIRPCSTPWSRRGWK